MYNINSKKKTAIHNEQQPISKQKIINQIINILANNELTITDAKNILYETSKKICNQAVTSSS